jgi:glycosyltransferase involved in cell wall biosynthesis
VPAVTTVVLVRPGSRVDHSEDRFTPSHVRELAGRFDHIVLVTDSVPHSDNGVDPLRLGAGGVTRTTATLESVLDSLGDEPSAVIVDGDIRTVRRAGNAAKRRRRPVFWWCDGPPAEEVQRATVDVIDAVLTPADESSIGRYVAIGAGIDTRALDVVPLPPQPPLRFLVLGRAVGEGGLGVPLRALAEARARGVDARLLIVDSLRVSTRSARQLAESLIADLVLTQSVELLDADGPVWLPDILRRVHAVIDAGGRTEVDHVVLETMACGRPVLSSRPSLVPLLADTRPPLMFATGDPGSLAVCIRALAATRSEELVEIGMRLRARVERAHSLPQWGASIAAVVGTLLTPRVN